MRITPNEKGEWNLVDEDDIIEMSKKDANILKDFVNDNKDLFEKWCEEKVKKPTQTNNHKMR